MAWYSSAYTVRKFGQVLRNAGMLEDGESFDTFLGNPSLYNDEFDVWEENGNPEDEESDGWVEFIDALDNMGDGEDS